MPKRSAGLLMYRWREGLLEVFLVHPGGPFWARKDLGAWSIPKGEFGGEESPDEPPLAAARREFEEETGMKPEGPFMELGTLRQAGGKVVSAWAFAGDIDPGELKSNLFEMEWPPRSGRLKEFPEVDRGAWFSVDEARERILKSQGTMLDRLVSALDTLPNNGDHIANSR